MNFLKYSLLISLVFFSINFFGQEEIKTPTNDDALPVNKKQYYLFSPRVSILVPHPISNKAFRKSFVGIYEISAGLNMAIFKGAFVGITYKNGLLKVTENKIPDLEADMKINNAGVKVGTDLFVGEANRIIFSAAVTAGKNWTSYSSFKSKIDGNPPPIKGFSANYVEPEINAYFLVEQNFGIGATVSFSFFNQNFNPNDLYLNEWTQFDKSNPGTIQYLSFGFGFYYSFLKKNK